ncbi:MAG: RDD family protein [Fimbriimonadaceae bacterium]|nr:RDD family protein [Fimbriimonadaceae bacterium]
MASLLRRIVASIVDAILAASCVFGLLRAGIGSREPLALIGVVVFALTAIPALMAVFEFRYGSTPGKWLARIRVTDDDGGRVRFSRALRRNFLKWCAPMGYATAAELGLVAHFRNLDFVSSTLLFAAYGLASMNVLAIWLSTYRQAIHDVLSDTLVLVAPRRTPIPPCPVKGLEEELHTGDRN